VRERQVITPHPICTSELRNLALAPSLGLAFYHLLTELSPSYRDGPREHEHSKLSKEQVPVLLTTALGGATAGQVLERASQVSLQAALARVLASDALLVSDGGRASPGCGRRLGSSTRQRMCRPASGCAGATTSKRWTIGTNSGEHSWDGSGG